MSRILPLASTVNPGIGVPQLVPHVIEVSIMTLDLEMRQLVQHCIKDDVMWLPS